MDTITRDLQQSISWTLLYADDVMLADTTRESLQEHILLWKNRLSQYGLHLNLNKTEYLETNPTTYTIEVDGSKLNKTSCFRYLGSRLSSDGGMEDEIRTGIKAA